MKKNILLFTLLFLTLIIQAQFNQFGYPFYTYFDSKDYDANDQNWDVIEDNNGLIYVANNEDGILQFDGETWRKIEIENKPGVRALAVDHNNVIYVGCSNEFGYLSSTSDGKLVFNSLYRKEQFPNSKFSIIYKVNIIGDTVFFSSDTYLLFKYFIKTDIVSVCDLPAFTLFTFAVNNNLFGSGYLDGLFVYNSDTVETVKGGEFFKSKNIFSLLPDSNSFTVVTGQKGLFNYNYQSGESKQVLNSHALNYLKQVVSYSATKSGSNILLATLGLGIVGVNSYGQISDVYDTQIGIKDHICASVNNYRNSVWSALSFGVAQFEYNSPFRYFSKESNIEGYITNIVKFNNKLFVATELGLFYLEEQKNKTASFVEIEGIEYQIRYMTKMRLSNKVNSEILLIGTQDGIYQLEENSQKVKLLNFIGIENYSNIFLDKNNSKDKKVTFYVDYMYAKEEFNELWVGTKSQRLVCLELKNNSWNFTDKVYDIGDVIDIITSDNKGNIWVSTKQSGLIKIDRTTNKSVNYGMESGLPVNYSLKLFEVSDGLLCASPKGVFKYNPIQNKFQKDTLLPEKYSDGTLGVGNLIEDEYGNYYINYTTGIKKGIDNVILSSDKGKFDIINDFKRLGDVSVNCFCDDESYIWLGISDVLYSYNKNAKLDISKPYKCLIRKVEGLDSTYFYGTYYNQTSRGLFPSDIQNEKQKPIIEYAQNDITFHYAAPYYEGSDDVEYSYLLDGFKDEWSKWSKEPKAVFTNLNEGHYIFNVKAKNIYDIESEVGTYEFTILPPWYRTVLAYFLYVVLALFAVWIIVKLYTRRLKQEKIRLEGIVRERTAEIREQRDEIAEQKQSIEDSILYASRIQRAILPSDTMASELLPEYFILFRPRDIVSGDYFWMNKIHDKTIVVAADCTGHGVPGAFMSMLGVSFLNEIVLKERVVEPHEILNKLRERVKNTLKQEGKEGEAKDGMDVALVVFDDSQRKLYFAGAYNPVLIYRGTELIELKADRMPIGIYIKEKESFTLNEFDYQPGDTFYIFSDGYPDQFGGEKGQKFRIKAMKELLESIQDKPMAEQKVILNQTIEDWMGQCPGQEQIDDMVVIGVRL